MAIARFVEVGHVVGILEVIDARVGGAFVAISQLESYFLRLRFSLGSSRFPLFSAVSESGSRFRFCWRLARG